MPPRYQQNALASSLVGTPGADTSQAQAAESLAKAAAGARESLTEAQNFFLQRADRQFNQAASYAMSHFLRTQYAKRQEEALLLQAQNHEYKNQISVLANKRLNEIKQEYSNDPTKGVQVFNEYLRNLPKQVIPANITQKQRMFFAGSVSNELRQAAEQASNWELSARKQLAENAFERDMTQASQFALSLGYLNDSKAFQQLSELWFGPEGRQRAYNVAGPEGLKKLLELQANMNTNYIVGLGLYDPDIALKLSDVWLREGYIRPSAAAQLRNELQERKDRADREYKQAQQHIQDLWRNMSINAYFVPSVLARTPTEIDTIYERGQQELRQLQQQKVPIEQINTLAKVLEDVQKLRGALLGREKEDERALLLAGAVEQMQQRQAREAVERQQIQADMLNKRINAQALYLQVLGFSQPEKDLPRYVQTLLKANEAFTDLVASGGVGLPGTAWNDVVKWAGELKAKHNEVYRFLAKKTDLYRKQGVFSSILQDFQTEAKSAIGVLSNTDVAYSIVFRPLPQNILHNLQLAAPGLSESVLQGLVQERALWHVADWENRNPNGRLTPAMVRTILDTSTKEIMADLRRRAK